MYSGTCLMWSPVGPHVQWNLSNVVTHGTSFLGVIRQLGGCIIKIEILYSGKFLWDKILVDFSVSLTSTKIKSTN